MARGPGRGAALRSLGMPTVARCVAVGRSSIGPMRSSVTLLPFPLSARPSVVLYLPIGWRLPNSPGPVAGDVTSRRSVRTRLRNHTPERLSSAPQLASGWQREVIAQASASRSMRRWSRWDVFKQSIAHIYELGKQLQVRLQRAAGAPESGHAEVCRPALRLVAHCLSLIACRSLLVAHCLSLIV